jgi:heme a synthase
MSQPEVKVQRFAKWSVIVLLYSVIVIMWGAYVRATGSGAGCGEHWPLCNGEVIPKDPSLSRVIEFSHRLSSGLSLLFVGVLFYWSRRIYRVGHAIRRATAWALGFILSEALVGAMLVLLKLVANDESVARAFVIAFHLVNTFMLLFWLARVTYLTRSPLQMMNVHLSTKRAKWNVRLCMAAFIITGAAGAIVALGDTLFPAKSLIEGFQQDLSPTAHFLIRLRIWHPLIAVMSTLYILLQCLVLPRIFKGVIQGRGALIVAGFIVMQVLGGVLNWIWLAPVPMQLFHLMLADFTWIALCFWYFNIGSNNTGDIYESKFSA